MAKAVAATFFEVEVLLHLDCFKPGVKARGVLPAHPRSQETARGSTEEPASENPRPRARLPFLGAGPPSHEDVLRASSCAG